MIQYLETKRQFQCALGKFAFEFAELEYALLYYWGIIEDPKNQNLIIEENIGSDFEARRKKVTTFIHKNLPNLNSKWNTINKKLSEINLERRYLIHGIGLANFNENAITAAIRHKGTLKPKKFSIDDIKRISNDIAHLLTGVDGLSGEFLIEFSTHRLNHYNEHTADSKIIYQVNNKILTDYKG